MPSETLNDRDPSTSATEPIAQTFLDPLEFANLPGGAQVLKDLVANQRQKIPEIAKKLATELTDQLLDDVTNIQRKHNQQQMLWNTTSVNVENSQESPFWSLWRMKDWDTFSEAIESRLTNYLTETLTQIVDDKEERKTSERGSMDSLYAALHVRPEAIKRARLSRCCLPNSARYTFDKDSITFSIESQDGFSHFHQYKSLAELGDLNDTRFVRQG